MPRFAAALTGLRAGAPTESTDFDGFSARIR
jgi:hypothetical protein